MGPETKRLKTAQKLVRIREQQLSQEVSTLEEIRRRKAEAHQDMQKAWAQYMSGVDRINKMRIEGHGGMLDAVEKGLDLVKQRWVDGLARVKQLDAAEQAQLARVRAKQGEVKVTEKLEERSRAAVDAVERTRERKILDDFGVRKFNENQRGGA